MGASLGGVVSAVRKSISDGWMICAPARSAAWYAACWVEKLTMTWVMSASWTLDKSCVVDCSVCWSRFVAVVSRSDSAPTWARAFKSVSLAASIAFRSVVESAFVLPEFRSVTICRSVLRRPLEASPITLEPGWLIATCTPAPISRVMLAVLPE